MTPRPDGFTLIELLVVIAILALLAGLSYPVLRRAGENARGSAARCLMMKIDIAGKRFRQDAGAQPWAAGPSDPAGPWSNELGYRLAHALTADELVRLREDLAAVGAAYAPGGGACIGGGQFDQPYGYQSHSNLAAPVLKGDTLVRMTLAINRLGAERGRIGVLCGNTSIRSTQPATGAPWVPGPPILAAPRSRGWSDDYLRGELGPRDLARDGSGMPTAIRDPWGQAFVYLNPTINGVLGYAVGDVAIGTQKLGMVVRADWFGFAVQPRAVTADRDSDARTHAAAGCAGAPELWSPGPDGAFDARRVQAVNHDNLPATDYLRGLR